MVELIDMFMPTPYNIVLIASIYFIHRSFHNVDMMGFISGTIIALSANFYIVKYLGASELAGMFITIVLFPLMEYLAGMAINKLRRKPEPQFHRPHMPHPHIPTGLQFSGMLQPRQAENMQQAQMRRPPSGI